MTRSAGKRVPRISPLESVGLFSPPTTETLRDEEGEAKPAAAEPEEALLPTRGETVFLAEEEADILLLAEEEP